MKLLTADTHWDFSPENEYRWKAFEHAKAAIEKYDCDEFWVLGDVVDRRDRFPGAFVNRLISSFQQLRDHRSNLSIRVLKGNHDQPIQGPPYWDFLNRIPGLEYITEPTVYDDLLALPFSANPKQEWKPWRLSEYKALFMHVTVTGALAENGTEMRNDNMVVLPRSNKQYSGDLHVPQTVRNLTYVGAPHVTRFGDNYPTRMLVLDDNYEIVHEVLLKTPRKHMIDITSIADLETLTVEAGDAARIRVSLPSGSEEGWPALEAGVMAWARSRGVSVASVDALVDVGVGGQTYNTDIDPEEILHDFCKGEELSEDLVAVGLALLKAARG